MPALNRPETRVQVKQHLTAMYSSCTLTAPKRTDCQDAVRAAPLQTTQSCVMLPVLHLFRLNAACNHCGHGSNERAHGAICIDIRIETMHFQHLYASVRHIPASLSGCMLHALRLFCITMQCQVALALQLCVVAAIRAQTMCMLLHLCFVCNLPIFVNVGLA